MYSVKDMPISGAIICNGHETKLNHISHIEINAEETPIDPTDSLYFSKPVSWNKSVDVTLDSSFSSEFLEEVCNPRLSPCEIEGTVGRIQKRRHKKFRINKKWAKRYGYYNVKVRGKFDPNVSVTWSDKEYPEVEATITDLEVYTE